MAFDSFYLAAVRQELSNKLSGARVDKIHQPSPYSLMLRLHGKEGNHKLLLSANPQRARIHLSWAKTENPLNAPLFCMVMRKHLEGAKLLSLAQKEMERIISLRFLTRNELGDNTYCDLIMEIMGKHSNIILVNEAGQIIDGIRRYGHSLSRHREVLPGRPYLAPPPQGKVDFRGLDTEALAKILFSGEDSLTLEQALVPKLGGFSPLMAKEAIVRSGLPSKLPVEEMGEYELKLVLEAVQGLLSAFDQGIFAPTLLLQEKGGDFAPFPLKLWEGEGQESFLSPSEAAEAYYSRKEEQEAFNSRKNALLKQVDSHYKRLHRKLKLQAEDLAKAQSGELYKLWGELLSANLYSLKKGPESVSLENFYEEGQILEVPLNPALSPEENMSRYFQLYTKAKHARESIKVQLETNREEAEYIGSILDSLEHSLHPEELEEIKRELVKEGYLKERPAKAKGKEKAKTNLLPPRRFSSAEGYDILVGRNNQQNDRLTLKTASPKDIWLHTKDIPGSHVIIRCEGAPVSDGSLVKAASLAAWFSRAQASSKVPVDYTTVDQVKKPNGAKPGMVIYFKQKTLLAEPLNPAALEELSSEGQKEG